jgi:DNA polymerase elongation subunit (family B)
MSSVKQLIIEDAHCSIVGDKVTLKGMRVSSVDHSEMAKTTCTNVVKCIDKNGSTERISKCLLHKFK